MRFGPGDPALRVGIARAIGELHGCAPVETYLEQDLVVCAHRRDLAPGARTPPDRELIATVEELTGRPVVAFLDASEPDPEMRAELFFLEPQALVRPGLFGLSAQIIDHTPVISVEGDLDRGTAPDVEREARRQIDRGSGWLVLDLSRTTFIDVAAVHLMETLSRVAQASGGSLSVVLTCPRARGLMDLVPPYTVVNVVGSLAEGLALASGPGLADTA